MRVRSPQIIEQTMNSIPSLTKEGEIAYSTLAKQIQHDEKVADFISKEEELDLLFLSQFNRFTHSKHFHTWHAISWWFAENYEFLCLNHIQEKTKAESQPSDPFYYLKEKALKTAMTIFPNLVKPLLKDVRNQAVLSKELFAEALLRILWGNKADLSMSGGKVDKSEIKSEASNLLLVDDMEDVWSMIQAKQELQRVIVCADNTGLEILCDFVLIAILLYYYPGLNIQYVIKEKPVFVSDVTPVDVEPTFAALEKSDDEGMIVVLFT